MYFKQAALQQQHMHLKQQHQQQASGQPAHMVGPVPMSQALPPQVTSHNIPPPQLNLTDLDMKAIKSQLSPNSQNILLKQLLASNKAASMAELAHGMARRPPSRTVSETTEVCVTDSLYTLPIIIY